VSVVEKTMALSLRSIALSVLESETSDANEKISDAATWGVLRNLNVNPEMSIAKLPPKSWF